MTEPTATPVPSVTAKGFLVGVDPKVFESLRASLPKYDPSMADAFTRIRFDQLVGDFTAAREAFKAFELFKPIVAPQIAPQIAETLEKLNQQNVASAAAVFKAIGPK